METWNGYKNHRNNINAIALDDEYEKQVLDKLVNQLIKQRKELQLSQRALAARSGIPQATIARIENRLVAPSTQVLIRIAHYLGLSLLLEKTTDKSE